MEENYTKSDEFKESFLESVDSKMNVKVDYEKKDVDFSWVDLFEETLPYIDNILRNPKRFIINEEEIVNVEQSKKVTVESVVHLTQHTNLIEDYNQKTGDVRPSKILNINKEESLDTYENRFIYTLIKQMMTFMDVYASDGAQIIPSYCYDDKGVKYSATAKVKNENLNIAVELSSSNHTKSELASVNGLSMEDRLKKLRTELKGFMNTEMIKTLTKMHTAIVRPPIRRTNVILKNPNFQKATVLWSYLQDYNDKAFSLVKDNQDFMENGYLKEKFDESFLLNYIALCSLTKKVNKEGTNEVMAFTVRKIIENILDTNEDITDDEFHKLIAKEYAGAKEELYKRDKSITTILSKQLDKFNNNMASLNKLLDR